LAYLTIFRTFDIPIICIILGFPITMLVQTQSILIFIISLGISVVNIVFSFDLLILFGERLHRVLYSHKTSPKKALAIRLFNIFSYIAVILGTIYIIQWVFGSIEYVFSTMILFPQAQFLNIVFSTLPYPFNPSYILSLAITPTLLSPNLWISTFVGLGLFIIITYVIHMKTSKTLLKITNYSAINTRPVFEEEDIQIKIKIRNPLIAFLRKDLSVASHDIKVFLSLIMPIILSCIFAFSFNLGLVSSPIAIERDIIIYCLSILLFTPIISSMLVYGISYIDLSGETVLASLPIVPRDRVKAKLILMLILQTLALYSPSLMYLFTPKFHIFLFATIIATPYVWIFLILTYELKIYFFNKFGKRYVIGDINPEKRIFKWTLIICIQYVLNFWITSFIVILFIYGQISTISTFYAIITILCIIFGILILNKMFPIVRKQKRLIIDGGAPTFFTKHIWISLIPLLILFFVNTSISGFVSNFFIDIIYIDPFVDYYVNVFGLLGVVLFNLSFFPLFFYIIPKFFGLPLGKKPVKEYLKDIKAGWLLKFFKIFLWSLIGLIPLILIEIFVNIPFTTTPVMILININILMLIFNTCLILWFELFFRGIILTRFLRSRKRVSAIIINASIPVIFYYIAMGFAYIIPYALPNFFLLFFENILIAFLCVKTKSILPGIMIRVGLLIIIISGGFPIYFL
ncbi:MAG: hypothetical protein ACFFE5_02950, partial [Candidatus Thorarchaeota archaeon]